MGAASRRTARKYLRAGERREQLLAVAAELVGKRGWDALGMIPLAEAAGVSRQLVYEHFGNLDALHADLTRFLFEGVFRAVAAVLERYPDDPAAAARTAMRLQLELPRGARLALRGLTCGPATGGTAVERLRARTRKSVTDLWTGPLCDHAGLDEREARGLAWMMTVASWGLLDLVEDGTFSAEEAAEFYVKTSLGAIAGLERQG